ncbi:MAG: S-layer homology domain-containing protein, partial [Oscillospiraceae bacterium]
VVVGGLDSLFKDDTIYTAGDTTVVHGGGTVAIRLTVSPLDPEEGAQAAAVVLNVTVQKEVTATGALSPIITPLTELPDLMEIFIPLEKEAQGHAIYSVQRSHNGKLDTISASPNTDGEYLKVEQDILVVYAKKFSTFAISYSDPEDSGYRIRAIAGDGGAIAPGSIYVTRNRNKTFTITPGSGYRIRDVLVDGVSVGSVTTYTFERVTAKHTIEAVFHSTACPSAKFTDVPPDTWYHDAADDLIAAGVMLGTSDKTFEPLRPLDRAQAVAMLSRLSGKVPLRSPAISFQDVAPAAWYFDTVGWSATSKVALGYGNDKFGPEDTVSREQLATMFFRYAGITPKALTVPIEGVSSWAATAMDWAVAAGILHGDDRQKLNPQGTATRAEAAVMFRQFLVLLEK